MILLTGLHVSTNREGCHDVGTWTSTCEVSNSGSQVDIGASTTTPGGGGRDERPSTPSDSTRNLTAPPQVEDCPLDRCNLPYDVVGPPDVTLADLASFRPASPTLGGEPAGFGVVGMPTNVFASASEQRIAGTLLGWEVTVRFVPVGFVFDYGDGVTSRSTSGGASWQRLGQAQFTPTPTTHVYAERGTYPVSVSVQYAASVDFGSGTWRPVAGYVTATTTGYDVRVVEVRTALVAKTCVENPRGPGC
jgi:hypothetical protein